MYDALDDCKSSNGKSAQIVAATRGKDLKVVGTISLSPQKI